MRSVTTEQKTTQNSVLREAPTRINSVPTGEEPREEYHAGIVSRAVTKTSMTMPAERRQGVVVNERWTHNFSNCSLMEQERGVIRLTQDP